LKWGRSGKILGQVKHCRGRRCAPLDDRRLLEQFDWEGLILQVDFASGFCISG
jgi:hypothetical protein